MERLLGVVHEAVLIPVDIVGTLVDTGLRLVDYGSGTLSGEFCKIRYGKLGLVDYGFGTNLWLRG